MNKPPAFQFYPKDLLSDGNAMAMPNECMGIYIKLLCFDWIDDGITENTDVWARITGFSGSQDTWQAYLEQLKLCFIEHPKKNGFITNKRLYRERLEQNKRRLLNSKNAQSRWDNIEQKNGNATAMRPHSKRIAKNMRSVFPSSSSASSLLKEKDILSTSALRASAVAVLEFLNKKANRKFPPTDSNIGKIVSRLKEGFTEEQIRQVVARKYLQWINDDKMHQYLRPKTLFSRENFNNYVGELVSENKGENHA